MSFSKRLVATPRAEKSNFFAIQCRTRPSKIPAVPDLFFMNKTNYILGSETAKLLAETDTTNLRIRYSLSGNFQNVP